jgi:hypothetical protein
MKKYWLSNIFRIIIVIMIGLCFSNLVFSWWGDFELPLFGTKISINQWNVHNDITEAALSLIQLNNSENYLDLNLPATHEQILDNAQSLDYLDSTYNLFNQTKYSNFNYAHFYNPDSGIGINDSAWPSAKDEAIDWFDEAITDYTRDKQVAYEKLGKMLHLLQDVAVPAHTYLIMPGSTPFLDYFEAKVDSSQIETEGISPVISTNLYLTDPHLSVQSQFNALAYKSYKNPDINSILDKYYSDNTYLGSNSWWKGWLISPTISSSDRVALQNYLLPEAVQYSAGLAMMVHDIFQGLDWSHFHHDLRRSGYTLASSDIGKANADQQDFQAKSNIPSTAYDKPTIADIDNDGTMEVIFTVNTATEGWLLELDEGKLKEIQADRPIPASATLVDINGDNFKELIFGADNSDQVPAKYFMYVYNHNVAKLDEYEVNGYSLPEGYDLVLDSSAIADIDLDKKVEIIFTTYSTASGFQAKLHILDFENNRLIEHQSPIALDHAIGTGYSISVADLQGDSFPEIVIPGRAGLEIYEVNSNGLVSTTKLCSNDDARLVGSAVIADVDKDDDYDIIYATASNSCPTGSSCANKLCKVSNFNTCSSSCTTLTSYPIRTPAVGNLDRDTANDEIVIVTRNMTDVTYPGNIRTFDSGLNLIWSYPASGTIDVFYSSPDIANVDNRDYDAEIVVGVGNGMLLIMNDDGAVIQNYSLGGEIASDAAIADYDGDGYAEIVVKHLNDYGGVQSLGASSRRVYDRDVEDPLYAQRFSAFQSMSTFVLDIAIMDGQNKQPQLDFLETQYVIETENLTLSATASDANGDALTYEYSSPFNNTNTWRTSIGDEGNYTALISVTDGNLTDSQYVDVYAFRSTTKFYPQFNDSSYNKSYSIDSATKIQLGINVSNDTKVLVAKFKLHGYAINDSVANYQNDAVVINANDVWTSNQYSRYIVDGNWSSYYSAGSQTEAIIEQRNLSVPTDPKHMVIHLKARVYEGGNGRFGVYNYGEGVYELVTSAMPATNESSQEFYFDVYEEDSEPLWAINSTHYNLLVEDLTPYLNGTAMRWYYDYINDDYASQKIYESEIKFLEDIKFPEDIVVQVNGKNLSFPGKLNNNEFIQSKFNNSVSKEQYNFTNTSVTRYITLPKNAEILEADFKFGSRYFTDYGQVLDDFENGNHIWNEYKSNPDYDTITFTPNTDDSYAYLHAWTPGTEGGVGGTQCSVTTNNSFDAKTVDWFEVTAYGSFVIDDASGNLRIVAVDDQSNYATLYVKTYTCSGCNNEEYTFDKSNIRFVKDNLTHWNVYLDGEFQNDANITNLNLSSRWRLRLGTSIEQGPNQTSTANILFQKVTYNDFNDSLYAPDSYVPDYKLYIDDDFVYSFSNLGYHEADLVSDIRRYLDGCIPKLDGTCDVPFRFYSEQSNIINLRAPHVRYRVRNIDFTTGLQKYSEDICKGNCTAPVTIHINNGGEISIADLRVYRDVINETVIPSVYQNNLTISKVKNNGFQNNH